MPENTQQKKQTFNKGEFVPEAGEYVCVPCGYHKEYQVGDKFTECISCFSGTNDGHEDFVEGMEMWERVHHDHAENTSEEKKV